MDTPGAFGGTSGTLRVGGKAVQKRSMSDMKKAFMGKVAAVKTALADKPTGKAKEKDCPKCGRPMSKCTCKSKKSKGPADD
jgi:hypothetical protein